MWERFRAGFSSEHSSRQGGVRRARRSIGTRIEVALECHRRWPAVGSTGFQRTPRERHRSLVSHGTRGGSRAYRLPAGRRENEHGPVGPQQRDRIKIRVEDVYARRPGAAARAPSRGNFNPRCARLPLPRESSALPFAGYFCSVPATRKAPRVLYARARSPARLFELTLNSAGELLHRNCPVVSSTLYLPSAVENFSTSSMKDRIERKLGCRELVSSDPKLGLPSAGTVNLLRPL